MSKDTTLQIENGFINIRVGAIILKDGKVLMSGGIHEPYYYSVGGRMQFGETADEAIVREVYEETGYKLEIDYLGFIHENHFNHDYRGINKAEFMEICFFYYMKVPTDFDPVMNFKEGEREEQLVWVDLDTNLEIYPQFFKDELHNPERILKRIVTDNRL